RSDRPTRHQAKPEARHRTKLLTGSEVRPAVCPTTAIKVVGIVVNGLTPESLFQCKLDERG
ncbi:hypothetical protein ACFFNW_08105, partial [Curtobacterium pusillum]|uniref:hypothetical protein n=1 Tax=Curtobacterium pusillum TaxID=69373 RepID=UPI0035E549DB